MTLLFYFKYLIFKSQNSHSPCLCPLCNEWVWFKLKLVRALLVFSFHNSGTIFFSNFTSSTFFFFFFQLQSKQWPSAFPFWPVLNIFYYCLRVWWQSSMTMLSFEPTGKGDCLCQKWIKSENKEQKNVMLLVGSENQGLHV